jgi:hypothetical protein
VDIQPQHHGHGDRRLQKPFGDYFSESSCEYPIDDSGFSDNPSGRRDYDVLLLGNSFAAGEVGCSWMPELRRRAPQLAVYNAGLPGTGVENWAMSQRYLLSRGFRFAHVVLIFIADDFFRPLAGKAELEAGCLHDITRCTPRDYAYPLTPGIDLAAVSASRLRTRPLDEIEYWWERNFWVSHFLIESLIRRVGGRPIAVSAATIAALGRFRPPPARSISSGSIPRPRRRCARIRNIRMPSIVCSDRAV